MIIVTTPRNPDGKYYDLEWQKKLAELADRYSVLVMYDEVFQFMHPASEIVRRDRKNQLQIEAVRAKEHILVVDVCKLMAEPLTKITVCKLSLSDKKLVRDFVFLIDNLHYADPRDRILAAVSECLHSEYMLDLIPNTMKLTLSNHKIVEDSGMGKAEYGLAFSILDLGRHFKDNVGLNTFLKANDISAFSMNNFYFDCSTDLIGVRIPLIRPSEELQAQITYLSTRLNEYSLKR
jgi:hypothetical protein